MSDITITFTVHSTDPTVPLALETWVDDTLHYSNDHVKTHEEIKISLDDDQSEHSLRWVLKNKLPEHTQVDEHNNIIKDAVIVIDQLMFNDIPAEFNILNLINYTHDFNGTGNSTQVKFYGSLGCNGTAEIKFKTPIYLWLIENI